MIWVAVQWGAAVFGAFFGGLLVFAGVGRVMRARSEPKPSEARIWGGVGVVIGVGLLGWAGWLALGHLLN